MTRRSFTLSAMEIELEARLGVFTENAEAHAQAASKRAMNRCMVMCERAGYIMFVWKAIISNNNIG